MTMEGLGVLVRPRLTPAVALAAGLVAANAGAQTFLPPQNNLNHGPTYRYCPPSYPPSAPQSSETPRMGPDGRPIDPGASDRAAENIPSPDSSSPTTSPIQSAQSSPAPSTTA